MKRKQGEVGGMGFTLPTEKNENFLMSLIKINYYKQT
jgi:hypothetical protein